ncbi:uncharacterized protein N7479_002913 [Penicillium vulpinum]|uniref:uncharacterized protein n=1 Tax=Penicillium vulpinum TaxID=29845 RepID=UPI002546B479|nr:uncharacterized protein N7479_002913 [Penicillium vulpinum]KAJ5972995.1 hypothetical protein N7479_002913 [Penicillium vulpinum]
MSRQLLSQLAEVILECRVIENNTIPQCAVLDGQITYLSAAQKHVQSLQNVRKNMAVVHGLQMMKDPGVGICSKEFELNRE